MKKIVLAFLSILGGFTAYAQIPTADMETWIAANQSLTTAKDPQNWASANIFLFQGYATDTSVTQSTHMRLGAYGAKIQTVSVSSAPSNFTTALPNDTLGILFTGTVNLFAGTITYGFTQTTRQDSLFFFYDSRPMANDSCFVRVIFEAVNGSTTDTIGEGTTTIGAVTNGYQLGTVKINYDGQFTGVNPTRATIYCSSSRIKYPKIGSVLYVDDFSFARPTGVTELSVKHGVKAFPNPAKTFVNLTSRTNDEKFVEVYDVTGKRVDKVTLKEEVKLDVTKYKQGLYLYQVTDKNGNTITSDKFNVVR